MKSKTEKNKKKSGKTRKRIFKKEDYNSNDGMLTSIWGPGMWHFLHSMSFNYPVNPSQEEKQHYKAFILSLKNILPCGKCRTNLERNIKKLPLTMSVLKNRENFSLYVYNLHELINKMLGKTSGLNYEDIRERYEHFRSRCNKKKQLNKEKGCITPVYGEKSKCILKIIPATKICESLQIDEKCNKKIV